MNPLVACFKVLADETRLRILVLLAQEKLYVCQLHGILNLPQPKVSKHLAKLRDLGYVEVERLEQFMLYRINTGQQMMLDILARVIEHMEAYPQLQTDQALLARRDEFGCR